MTPVTSDFAMARTKAGYYLTDALSPYFRSIQRKDMDGVKYTLLYDETTNNARKKELMLGVRYWSNSIDRVVSEHLQTFFIGSAKAVDLHPKLLEGINNAHVREGDLLMLGADGPNVNKAVHRLMNESLLLTRKKPLIDIGSCNIHTVHNGFEKGLDQLGNDGSDLIIYIHDFFEHHPVRWEDFAAIVTSPKFSLEELNVMKHVVTRWLTIGPAAERILYLWDPLIEYFCKFLPNKKGSDLHTKPACTNITKHLKNPTMKAELMFVTSSASVFTDLTMTFQREEPLVHLLYTALRTLVKTLLGRSCKDNRLPYTRVFEVSNRLALENVQVGDDAATELRKVKDPMKKTLFLKAAQDHYIAACRYVVEKSSLGKATILKDLLCLHPDERKKASSTDSIVRAAKALPWEIDYTVLRDEWKLMQDERDPSHYKRIDEYWAHFLALKNPSSGGPKFPTLAPVVKSLLTLSHGQADIERGFSESANILTPDKASMSERTLNAHQNVRSLLKRYGGKAKSVPITKELINMGRGARSHYQLYLEEEKRQADMLEAQRQEESKRKEEDEEARRKLSHNKRRLEDEEALLKKQKLDEEAKTKRADKLLKEANTRLEKAIASADMEEVALAKAMLDTVTSMRKEAEKQRVEVSMTQKSVDKRKSTLIDHFGPPKKGK